MGEEGRLCACKAQWSHQRHSTFCENDGVPSRLPSSTTATCLVVPKPRPKSIDVPHELSPFHFFSSPWCFRRQSDTHACKREESSPTENKEERERRRKPKRCCRCGPSAALRCRDIRRSSGVPAPRLSWSKLYDNVESIEACVVGTVVLIC
jgi:hypothetical protein